MRAIDALVQGKSLQLPLSGVELLEGIECAVLLGSTEPRQLPLLIRRIVELLADDSGATVIGRLLRLDIIASAVVGVGGLVAIVFLLSGEI